MLLRLLRLKLNAGVTHCIGPGALSFDRHHGVAVLAVVCRLGHATGAFLGDLHDAADVECAVRSQGERNVQRPDLHLLQGRLQLMKRKEGGSLLWDVAG